MWRYACQVIFTNWRGDQIRPCERARNALKLDRRTPAKINTPFPEESSLWKGYSKDKTLGPDCDFVISQIYVYIQRNLYIPKKVRTNGDILVLMITSFREILNLWIKVIR